MWCPVHFTHARTRVWLALASGALVLAMACATLTHGASSETTVITAEVRSATTLDVTGCLPDVQDVTNFGLLPAGTTARTDDDCIVSFGSTNDTAALRVAQSDGLGTAMARATGDWTRHTGTSGRYIDADSAGGTTMALASNGAILRSLDGGDTWSPTTSSGGTVNSEIAVVSASVAWVTTNDTTVRRTTNANTSATWSNVATPPGMTQTRGIVASSSNVAWVAGSDRTIASTTNGGTSWTTHVIPASVPASTTFRAMHQLDANSLAAWNDSELVATSDGTTWRDLHPPSNVKDVWIMSDTTMVIASRDGLIYTTTNAHQATPTWTPRALPTHLDFAKLIFTSATDGIAVGNDGILARTDDGGVSWTLDDFGTSLSAASAAATGSGEFVAVGAGMNVQHSDDGGVTWDHAVAPLRNTYHAVSMTTDATGWTVGNDGTIMQTTDRGQSWSAQTSNTGSDLFGVHAFDPHHVVAVGRDGTIVTTDDGGTTWTPQTVAGGIDLWSVGGTTTGIAWAAGEDGTILRTSSHGQTWSVQSSTPGASLLTVAVVDEDTAVIFGRDGAALRTDDGHDWTALVLPTGTEDVRASSVLAGTDTVGYVGASRFVESVDGGQTWTIRAAPGALRAWGVTYVTDQLLYAMSAGTHHRSFDGGATWQSFSSDVGMHWAYDLDTVDRALVVAVGDGAVVGSTGSTDPISDYDEGVSDWYGDGDDAFGICLRETDADPTWTPNVTCDQTADGAHWQGVPTATSPASEVARSLAPGIFDARFRFGVRISASQPPGPVTAGVSFVVIAPA